MTIAAVDEAVQPGTLRRSMRVVGVLLLTLSAITPASSVFIIVPGVISQAGTGAFLSMLLGAVLCIPIAFAYAELASAFPIAGGDYAMVGRAVGPAAGFAMMGLIFIGGLTAPAVLSLGAGVYIADLIPGLNVTAVAIAIIVATTVCGILHIRTNALVTGVFLLLELAALALLAVLGILHARRSFADLALHPLVPHGNALAATPLAMIGLATTLALFAYNGYGLAVYFSEEMHEAPRLVARTILLALLVTVVSELVPVAEVLRGAPDLSSFLKAESPFSLFVSTVAGPWTKTAVDLAIVIAVVNAALAALLIGARFLFSTGRDECWNRRINVLLARIHPRFHSPWIATLAAGACAVVATFLGLQFLLTLTGAGVTVICIGICIATLLGRRSGRTDHAAYRMPLFPLMPVAGVIVLLIVVWLGWQDPDAGRRSLLVAFAIIAVSLCYYFIVLRRRANWSLRASGG